MTGGDDDARYAKRAGKRQGVCGAGPTDRGQASPVAPHDRQRSRNHPAQSAQRVRLSSSWRFDTGATRANSKVADFLFYGICGGTGKPAFKDERARVTAAIFWMKTRGGWSETSTHK